MRYLMLVSATKEYEAGQQPDAKLVAAMGNLIGDLVKSGKLIDTAGLLPSSQGTRIRVANGKVSVTDGPFAETKELIGGYAMFNLSSSEEALKLGRDFMQLHVDCLGSSYEGQLEIRPIADPPPNFKGCFQEENNHAN
ncbi:MAG TPA: YciI family protein [Terriglobales bacterium]|jgi:hypothetical protein